MKILPVIHMLNENQVRTNILTCIECGIDSVFLINHEVNAADLLICGNKMKKEFSNMWIGVNILGVQIEDAINKNLTFDGMWCDQTMTQQAHINRRFKGQLFSGYNFKYQPKSTLLLSQISNWTDVITTSGSGTGKQTPLEKVKNIRSQTEAPIAIASGVNKDNIVSYKGLVNYVLVASSITSASEMIEKDKLKELIDELQKNS